MGAVGPHVAIKSGAPASPLSRSFDWSVIPPRLVNRDGPAISAAAPRRTKIWEFSSHLHCSIIGTCLSTTELRHVLKKLGTPVQGCTDHELHGIAVTLAGRHDDAARQLHKALDQRHKLAVSQFGKATTEQTLRSMWSEAVRRGEIPGAYWAILTHPVTTQAIVREAFGEVHMLSHLVGSANRADIRRLCQLEAEKAGLTAKLERQQLALRDAVVTRDAQIRDLRQALAERIVSEPSRGQADEGAALRDLVTDLERRLGVEARRRATLEERLAATQVTMAQERSARVAAERESDAMRRELDVAEASLAWENTEQAPDTRPEVRLDGVVLLYVGGRPNLVAQMRAAVERLGATLLHHDGGVENQPSLLPGLTSRCDLVMFPVDCISHEAANAVKVLCRQSNKRFVPLRSASVTSLLTALHAREVSALSDAAD
jgi:hypothetical protein